MFYYPTFYIHQNIAFWYFKVQVSKLRCANIIADSETFKRLEILTPELVGDQIEMVV